MTGDAVFLFALVLLQLAVVSGVAAWADRRRPWTGLALAVIGAGLLGYLYLTLPGGLPDWRRIPEIAVTLLAQVLR